MAVASEAVDRPAAGRTLAVAATGTLLVLVAFTTPLATLPSTAASLHAGTGAQAWILSGMSVGCAAGLLSSGALGDDYGRRRTFLAGAAILAAGSLLGAVAPDAVLLVLARILQGLGGAAIVACSLGLIGNAYPEGPERVRATGVWGAALAAGVAIGPFLALRLQAAAGWRSTYAVTAVLATALAAVGRSALAESRAARPRPVDAAGTGLLALGLSPLLAGLVEGRSGWGRPATLGLLLLGGALVAAVATGAGVLSITSFTPIIVEQGLAGSALAGVSAMLAWSGLSALTPLAARWLSARITPRVQMAAGLLGCAAGQLALLGLHPGDPVVRLLPGLLLAGAANGVLNAALGRQAVSTVPVERAAMGSGANNTARYVGSAIGLALVTPPVGHRRRTRCRLPLNRLAPGRRPRRLHHTEGAPVELLPVRPTVKTPAQAFTGDVYITPIYNGTGPSRMTAALVRFTPGARTNWHSHAVGQTLHVTEGVGLVGTRDGHVLRIHAGETVICPPDEDHWHGAATDTFMSHLALLEAKSDGSDPTTWLEPVTDEQYEQANKH